MTLCMEPASITSLYGSIRILLSELEELDLDGIWQKERDDSPVNVGSGLMLAAAQASLSFSDKFGRDPESQTCPKFALGREEWLEDF